METGGSPNLTTVDAGASDDAKDPLGAREAPHNTDAEQALLGAILLRNEAGLRVSEFLEPMHFFEPVHGRIYDAAMKIIERGQVATPVTLHAFFERDESLADVGGDTYLGRLAGEAVTIINAVDYGRVIYDCYLRRKLIDIGEDVVNVAYDPTVEETPTGQIESAEQALFQLAESGTHEGGFLAFRNSVTSAIQRIETAFKSEARLVGVSTGLADLDKILGGLQRSDLIVLAGRPSMGKTALATNIAFHAARTLRRETAGAGGTRPVVDGAVVGFFSLEMAADQLVTRILAEVSEVPSNQLRQGQISNEKFHRVVDASNEINSAPFFIDDTPALSIAALRTRARRLKRQHDLGLVVVDYLQLVRPAGRSSIEYRVQEVSQITQGLKALAKELDVPVLALSQLSRAVEQRDDKRPLLSDLRDSGSIEQDADVVLFIYREEYYLFRQQPKEGTPEHDQWQTDMDRVLNKAEIIVGKQRHGPTGSVDLFFRPEYTKFGNMERPSHATPAPPL